MASVVQRSFAAGEIAPALYAHVDNVRYATGLRTCRNWQIMRYGGASTRAGTQYVNSTANAVRLIPFVFSSTQAYALAFGDRYMRVIKNGQMLFTAGGTQTITNISSATNAVVTTAAAHGYSSGRSAVIQGVSGLNSATTGLPTFTYREVVVQVVDSTHFQIGINTTGLSAFVSGGTVSTIYQIDSPYAFLDLANLNYAQSADVVTITHPSYPPQELSRSGDVSWAFSSTSFAPSLAAPTGLTDTYASNPPLGTSNYPPATWVVTSVDVTGQESIASTPYMSPWPAAAQIGGSTVFPYGNTILTWSAATGAVSYNVYRNLNGVYGFIGSSASTTFIDSATYPVANQTGVMSTPDITDNPPTARNPFSGSGNYPSAVAYFQQRQCFANQNNNPETVYASQPGLYQNFDVHTPSRDSDAVTFSLVGSGRADAIQHLLSLRTFLIFTAGGEWAAKGGPAGIITPAQINPVQYSNYGTSNLAPLVIGTDALFVQARGSIVRDIGYEFATDTYKGNDLTIFSNHLIDGFTMTSWAHAQIPNSIVWIVRSDGTLLGLTYLKEQQILAWHHHDFDGQVLSVCSIPEGKEDAVYIAMTRTVNGQQVYCVERFGSRLITSEDDVTQFAGMDASRFQDGNLERDAGGAIMTLTSSGGWTSGVAITVTSSVALFSQANDVLVLTGSDGLSVKFSGATLISSTQLSGFVDKTVPASLQGIAAATWVPASNTVTGLWNLEGKQVSVLADGSVIASPNNPSIATSLTVTDGSITLPDSYVYIRVGLPFTCDLETLDIDTAQGASMAHLKKNVSEVTIYLDKTRGLFVGGKAPATDAVDPLLLTELRPREFEDYGSLPGLKSGHFKQQIESHWNSHGRIFIRQVDPLPASVLGVVPTGMIPIGTGA